MEIETAIKCPGINYVNKSRLSLVDLDDTSTDLKKISEKFMVRITMINKCKKLGLGNRCDLTNQNCIFGELPVFERINFEDDGFEDDELFGRSDY